MPVTLYWYLFTVIAYSGTNVTVRTPSVTTLLLAVWWQTILPHLLTQTCHYFLIFSAGGQISQQIFDLKVKNSLTPILHKCHYPSITRNKNIFNPSGMYSKVTRQLVYAFIILIKDDSNLLTLALKGDILFTWMALEMLPPCSTQPEASLGSSTQRLLLLSDWC